MKYYSVLDDNNQLGVFNLRNDNIYENIIDNYKSYNVRPLAFFSDAYIFSWFWDNMYALLLIMLIMHVCNLFFVYKICQEIDIKLNGFCLILFALSPILMEGLYWISASTRIVFSLFLCLASIYLLLLSFKEVKKGKKLAMFLSSIILNLLCVGYYEQTIALNLFLFAFVLICLKKYRYMFIPLTSTVWIGIWYVYFMLNGKMQSRGALNLSGIFGAIINCCKDVYMNLKNSYLNFVYSLTPGREVIFGSWISIILLALVAFFVYYLYKNNFEKDDNMHIWKKLLLGMIIFIAPFLPFLVLETSYIAMRNMYMSILGLMIILEVLIDLVLKPLSNEKITNVIKTAITAFVMALFIISNIDGIHDFKKVNDLDNKVVKQVIDAVGDDAFEKQKSISINYDMTKLVEYKNLTNYVGSCIESDWAMAGKIQVMRDDIDFGKIYINSNQDKADYVLYFDENMELVTVQR